jgi:hypothetical protein
LFPPIPSNLSKIDETTVGRHFLLHPTDICYYIWEYTRRGGFSASPTNNLISNLKKKPSKILANPREGPWKERAIEYAGQALSQRIRRSWVETIGTIVPVPPSKIPGHADYDDRLNRLLQGAFGSMGADVRPLLVQTSGTTADHETSERQRFEELLDITRVDESSVGAGIRSNIMVFDDVLNSGKHFKVAQHLLSARFPGVPIIGVFLARCLPDPPVEFEFVELTV